MSVSRRTFLGGLSAVAASAVAGCGLSSGSAVPLPVAPGSIRPVPELRGLSLTVGSKEFTEQKLLGYVAEFALVAAGANVRDLTNITGSSSARNAMVSGQIDLMYDYTGSSWISYNGMTEVIPDPVEQFQAVKKLDEERNGITWTALALRADNTYAFALNRKNARRLDVSTLSDLARVVREQPQEATFCVESEFASRNDGMPGVAEAYGFDMGRATMQNLSSGTIYAATAAGKACNFGEVYSTDGRIEALDLVLLEDDKQFFPRYNIGVTMPTELLERYPQLTGVFQPVSDRLTNAVLVRLNRRIDVDGLDPADVARDWMVEQGFVTLPGSSQP